MNDQMMQARMYGQLGHNGPTVTDARDAVVALKRRAEVLRSNLEKVASWQSELKTIERMIAAAEG